jgi:eukaryotic-like serine/threonine-protein kinase
MKKLPNKFWKKLLVLFIGFILFFIIFDDVIMPLFVGGREQSVPNVIGKNKDDAIKILEDAGFHPVVQTSRFDQRFQKNQVIFQKPASGIEAKVSRRIYLSISGGEPMIKMPSLIGKTLRDAQVTLEKIGLAVGKIDSVESEFPANTIVEQQYFEGRDIAIGTKTDIKVSLGPKVGMIRVPNLLGKSLFEAEDILKSMSLKIGRKTFISSPTLLPNTIMEQDPSENSLLNLGDSVNVFLSHGK